MSNSSASDRDLQLDAYDYHLPEGYIAQNPVEPRDRSRLLVVRPDLAETQSLFKDLPTLLQPNDLLVLNDTRVLPARLYGRKSSGAQVEVLLLEERAPLRWLALVKPGKRLKPGAEFDAIPNSTASPSPDETFRFKVLDTDEDTGGRILELSPPSGQHLLQALDAYGHVPFPPYVTNSQASASQYQTVYAREAGSAAAPTAGLHFTPELFEALDRRGIQRTFVTLHVGVGTFRPVEVADIRHHIMHEEWAVVPETTVRAIQDAKARGGRIIAVGTTAVRSLESAAASGQIAPFRGKTDLFIYPGYRWRVVEGLITNFHLPKSSLMMLVSARIGRERLLSLYQTAIAESYRFFSFGDAMLILPETPAPEPRERSETER